MVNRFKRFKLFISLSSLVFLILFAFFPKLVFFNQVFSASAPSAPIDLLTEGVTSPSNVTDHTPEFSAIYNDSDEADIANKYQIQVNDTPNFSSTFWDSGSSGTVMSNCSEGNRCADISYAGSTLNSSTTYYWRIKFWDDEGTGGGWSNSALLNTSLTCGDANPFSSPNLFQIDVNDTQATLYYASIANANNYYIAYSEKPNTFEHGTETNQGYSTGVLPFTINLLKSNTVYYFKVRGQNGCMSGNWSQEMSIKTRAKGFLAMIPFYKYTATSWLPLINKPTIVVQPKIKPTPTETVKIEESRKIEVTPISIPQSPIVKIPETKKRCFLWWCW